MLLEDPGYTSPQIAEKLNVSRISVTKYLKTLKEKGLIERIGSDRKGYWRIIK
ncbi:MAG: winged helix-turn-helix transcriptional regulator [Solobacterium sp.]|nr:winged helix-turn-helix transcriptional regulator [Solobacterium sp.]